MGNSTDMDIRAIDLKKAINRPLQAAESPAQMNDRYLCLGHFETIEIRHLHSEENDQRSPFLLIGDDILDSAEREEKDYFRYTLYLLSNRNRDEMETFWSYRQDYPILVLSRIHLRLFTTVSPMERLSECLKKDLEKTLPIKSELQKNGVFLVSRSEEGKTVECALYQTPELGDIVVAMKSNSINLCLEIAKFLMAQDFVGDVYSYCGLHSTLFRADEREKYFTSGGRSADSAGAIGSTDESETTEPRVETQPAVIEERIGKCSMRFAVCSSFWAQKYWEKMQVKDNINYVTGTADAIVDLSGVTVGELVHYLSVLLSTCQLDDDGEPGTECSVGTHDAFYDVITRIGIPYGDVNGMPEAPPHLKEQQSSIARKRVLAEQKIQEISAKADSKIENWMPTLSAQTRQLFVMMDNCIMDDLSLLIYPSANALICQLHDKIVKSKQTLTASEREDVERFLDAWGTLSNDIMLLECHLMQNPKLQAPRVYVPAALLAFYMSFLDRLRVITGLIDSDILKKNPGLSLQSRFRSRSYRPLITHNISLRTSTLCVMDGLEPEDKPEDKKEVDCALLVSVPSPLLYDPNELAITLCHEYLHYSGELSRHRQERENAILKTCAGLLLLEWEFRPYTDMYMDTIEISDWKGASDSLVAELRDLLKEKNHPKLDFLREVRDVLQTVMVEVFLDWQLQAKIIADFASHADASKKMPTYANKLNPKKWHDGIISITNRVNNILELYHECYADCVAVIALELTKEEYFKGMFSRELELKSSQGLDEKLKVLAVQAALVCLATGISDETDDEPSSTDDLFIKWKKAVKEYIQEIREGHNLWAEPKGRTTPLMYLIEYHSLLDYLQLCSADAKSAKEKCFDDFKGLREMLDLISAKNLDLRDFQNQIDNYRTEIMSTEIMS